MDIENLNLEIDQSVVDQWVGSSCEIIYDETIHTAIPVRIIVAQNGPQCWVYRFWVTPKPGPTPTYEDSETVCSQDFRGTFREVLVAVMDRWAERIHGYD